MNKLTHIATLKQMINSNVLERVELCLNGVQLYKSCEGEEYTVIIAYAKQGGRCRRFLASQNKKNTH